MYDEPIDYEIDGIALRIRRVAALLFQGQGHVVEGWCVAEAPTPTWHCGCAHCNVRVTVHMLPPSSFMQFGWAVNFAPGRCGPDAEANEQRMVALDAAPIRLQTFVVEQTRKAKHHGD